jgi:large subunit ribosomal protein L3
MLEIIAKKIGMTHSFKNNGSTNAITLIKIYDNIIIDVINNNHDNKIKVGYNKIHNTKKINKSIIGFFNKKNIPVYKYIKESKTSKLYNPTIGQPINYDEIIKLGDKVSIQGISSGKGFAGVMKRWNFRGLEASHGVSISHRSHGSTGQRQDPGKTFKGKKMAGHLGCDKVTVNNLNIEYIDLENSMIGVSGSIPGNNGENIVLKFKNI